MTITRKLRIALLFLVLACTVGCDQTTKHIARQNLNHFDTVTILNGFGELRLADNPGAFLSLGVALPPVARTIIFTVGVGVGLFFLLRYLAIRPQLNTMIFAGLALVMAGGVSNLIDRLTRNGLVTDFITLRWGWLHTGVFNVADMTIMVGVGILAFALWKPDDSTSKKSAAEDVK